MAKMKNRDVLKRLGVMTVGHIFKMHELEMRIQTLEAQHAPRQNGVVAKEQGGYKNGYDVNKVIRENQGKTNTEIGHIIGVSHQWITAYKLFNDGWQVEA